MERTAIRGGDNDSMTTWLPLASTRRSFKGRAERDDGSNPCLLFGPSPSLVAEHWLVIAEKWASGHSSSSIAASFLPSCAHEWGCYSIKRIDGERVHALVAESIARPASPPLPFSLRIRLACGVLACAAARMTWSCANHDARARRPTRGRFVAIVVRDPVPTRERVRFLGLPRSPLQPVSHHCDPCRPYLMSWPPSARAWMRFLLGCSRLQG
jgi:hypothetical protein